MSAAPLSTRQSEGPLAAAETNCRDSPRAAPESSHQRRGPRSAGSRLAETRRDVGGRGDTAFAAVPGRQPRLQRAAPAVLPLRRAGGSAWRTGDGQARGDVKIPGDPAAGRLDASATARLRRRCPGRLCSGPRPCARVTGLPRGDSAATGPRARPRLPPSQ